MSRGSDSCDKPFTPQMRLELPGVKYAHNLPWRCRCHECDADSKRRHSWKTAALEFGAYILATTRCPLSCVVIMRLHATDVLLLQRGHQAKREGRRAHRRNCQTSWPTQPRVEGPMLPRRMPNLFNGAVRGAGPILRPLPKRNSGYDGYRPWRGLEGRSGARRYIGAVEGYDRNNMAL